MLLLLRTILIFSFTVLFWTSLHAQKTDKVFLSNGNVITCEIVELIEGKLDCKTDDLGRLNIKWDAVDSLWSDKEFEIHLRNGTIVFTTFDSTFYNYSDYTFDQMIDFIQIKKKFWKKIDGNIDLGFSYAKSSGILQLNIDSKVTYNFYRGELDLKYETIFTIDRSENRTDRKDLKLNYLYLLDKKNYISAIGGFDQNSQLGIQRRLSLGAGFGKNVIYGPKTRLLGTIGLVANNELSTEANTPTTNNLEISGLLRFRKFSYRHPELDIDSSLKLFASVNEWGRLRGDFNVSARIEVINDFYIKLTLYYSFDSRPADVAASQNDWGTTLMLSYTF